tara:strand:- start:443 stop:697 length:255 start_codon:yes stop_codon:yes gene_type:complete
MNGGGGLTHHPHSFLVMVFLIAHPYVIAVIGDNRDVLDTDMQAWPGSLTRGEQLSNLIHTPNLPIDRYHAKIAVKSAVQFLQRI